MTCEKCSAPLALADTLCQACGTAVPRGAQAEHYFARATAAAEAGQFKDAVRQLEKALSYVDEAQKGQPWLKKMGLWIEKGASTDDEEKAEAAFRQACELNDKDELAHQLWINHLVRRGLDHRAEKAYQERLSKDPLDSIASRQLSVLKLAREFKAQPVKVTLDLGAPKGFFARALAPTPMKLTLFGANTVGCAMLTLLFYFSGIGQGNGANLDPELQGMGSADILGMLADPTSWAVSTLLSAAVWMWLWRSRR